MIANHDPQTGFRRISPVFAQGESENRPPAQPRHVQDARRRREARARSAVLQAQELTAPGGLRPVACYSPDMDHARTAPLSAKAQVEALFDSLALDYLRDRDRQTSFL